MSGQAQRRAAMALLAILAIVLCRVAAGALDWQQFRAVAQLRHGAPGLQAAEDWLRLIDQGRQQPISEQLRRINEFFNARTVFGNDIEVWRQADYWATPLETLARARGDCEDFAIAKYLSLLELGIPRNRLRLIYVKARVDGASSTVSQAHMVLGYYPDPSGEPQILDNLVGSIHWASARPDLSPVFSFNGEGLWAGSQRAPGDPSARLSRWRELLARLKEEGFQ
ncbi:MAG: transglutaminase-like cysteine peptidase [Panacagrimonas sp.]